MADNNNFSPPLTKESATAGQSVQGEGNRLQQAPPIQPESGVPTQPGASDKSQNSEASNKQRFTVEELYGSSENVQGTLADENAGNMLNQEKAAGAEVLNSRENVNTPVTSENVPSAENNLPSEAPKIPDSAYQSPSNVLQQNDSNQIPPPDPPLTSMQPEPSQPGPEIKPPKKRPLKMMLFVSIFMLVVLLLVYLAVRFTRSGGGKLFGKKGEVVWWGVQLEEVEVQPLIQDYQEEHPDVKISYVKQSVTDYRERLTNALASGSGPDIFEIHNTWPPMFANELSPIPSEIMSVDDFTKTFYPVIVNDLNSSKGLIAIPLEYDGLTLFINEDIFAAGAKAPPKTWDELRALAGDFTQRGDGDEIIQSGVPMGYTKNIDHWPEIIGLMIIQNGASPGIPLGPRAKGAIDYYMLLKSDNVWNETLPDSTDAFARGKVAMYFGPSRRASDITNKNKDLRFRTVPLPQLPKEKPTDPDYSYATYWAQSVWERSRNKEAAWDFLKFMVSRESLEKMNQARRERTNLERISPRIDMANIWSKDPVLGSVVTLAPNAKSWYLASDTNDGSTGINAQVNQVYQDVITQKSGGATITLEEASKTIAQILGKYGIPVK